MPAQVVDLARWRAEHPPMVRLVNITLKCWGAYWRMMAAASSALWRIHG